MVVQQFQRGIKLKEDPSFLDIHKIFAYHTKLQGTWISEDAITSKKSWMKWFLVGPYKIFLHIVNYESYLFTLNRLSFTLYINNRPTDHSTNIFKYFSSAILSRMTW